MFYCGIDVENENKLKVDDFVSSCATGARCLCFKGTKLEWQVQNPNKLGTH